MTPIVEEGGFGPIEGSDTPGGCNTGLLVVGPDRAGTTRALRRVARRLSNVIADGRELGSIDDLDAAEEQGLWGVNYVSEPEQYVRGVAILVDFKGEDLTPEMGATYRAIVREELEREGVRGAQLIGPEPEDIDTRDEGMFAAANARSVEFARIGSLEDLLRMLEEHMPADALVMVGSPYAPDSIMAFLEAHDRRAESPLAFLSEWPAFSLDAETMRSFWKAAAARGDRPFDLVGTPLWVAHDDRVLAYVPGGRRWVIRARADLDPRILNAFASLQAADPDDDLPRPRIGRPDSFRDAEATQRLAQIAPQLQPEHDWWAPAWRTWEPVPEPPRDPPPPFDAFETAARVRASVDIWGTAGHRYWHWRHAPFGPAVSNDEATAMLVVCQGSLIRNAKEASLALTRYSPGPMTFEEASRRTFTEYLPAATRLAALVAIGGAAATTEWILGLDTGSGHNPYHFVHTLHGYRAAVLPHLNESERAALRDRVRTQCEARPWDEGKWPPHAGHLLAPQLALHDVCARTLETNPEIFGTVGAQLLVYGVGSADEVVAAHRRLLNRFFQPWNGYAWLAVTGMDGVPELFEWIQPQHSWAEERLAPLLRLSDPAIEPYMTALLDTSVDKWARAWLKRNQRE